jgi:hypothetical protein
VKKGSGPLKIHIYFIVGLVRRLVGSPLNWKNGTLRNFPKSNNPPRNHGKREEITKEKVIFWLVFVSKVSDVPGCGWYVDRVMIIIVFCCPWRCHCCCLHFSWAMGGRSEGFSTGRTTIKDTTCFVRGLYQKLR